MPFILALLFALSAREQMLVSTSWLHANLDSVRVLHVGDRAGYDAGHIPGAILIEPSSLVTKRDGTPNELPAAEALEALFTAAGVGSSGRIVIYSSEPIPAARAWFTLDYLGHGDRASILDGGYAKWVADGYAVSKESTVAKPAPFAAKIDAKRVIDTATLRAAKMPLIDARPPKQFTGEEPGADVRRGGHIPGAANVPYATNLDAKGQYLSLETLRGMYEDAGASEEKANVAYCRTGMQAAVTYFVLKYLGYDAALYDASFIDWSRGDDPVEP